MSRTKNVSPACFGTFGSVRATRMPKRQYCAPEVQIFCPLTIQPSPSRSARVRNCARSDPPEGSENNWHQISSPRSAGGAKRARCSGVPQVQIVGIAIARPMPNTLLRTLYFASSWL